MAKWKVQLLGCTKKNWLTFDRNIHDDEPHITLDKDGKEIEVESIGLSEAELSVVKLNNKHGQRSWGWDGNGKIILPANGLNPGSVEERVALYRKAELMCDAFNQHNVD